jgi:hypothetical protein
MPTLVDAAIASRKLSPAEHALAGYLPGIA